MDKGDVSWMMTSTVLVLFMTIPGLALFYGGLVRSKNMLSVLMQTTVIACVMMLVWVIYGYSFAFGGSTSPGGAARRSCSWAASPPTACPRPSRPAT
jgi:Amt family ammonium transporter